MIDGVAHHGLVIVRGPAGSGKTAAMVDWASTSSPGRGVWITLDTSLSDRFGFWRLVFEALEDAAIPLSVPAGNFVAVEQPVPELQQRLVRAFSGLPTPITLVIDDFHHVSESGVDDDLAIVLQRAPHVRVIIGTRSKSTLEDSRNQVRLDPVIVGPDDLLFTREETTTLASQLFPEDPDLGRKIHDAVGGWAIATRLVLLELERAPGTAPERAVQKIVAAQTSGDAGATMLTAEPDSDVLRFALRSSLAGSVPFELAARLADGVDVHAAIAWFEREGLGSVHPEGIAFRFRWQPLVQAALTAELHRRFPSDLAPTHRLIAQWHVDNGEAMAAINHASAADDWALASSVTRQFFSDLMLYHQPELMNLLENAPRGRLRANLTLVATLAVLHYASPSSPVERRRALADFGLSLAVATMRQGSRTERLWIYSSLLATQRVSGKYDSALSTAERIITLAATFDAEERAEVRGILPLLTTQVATTMLYTQHSERAGEQLQLVPLLAGPGDAWSEIHAESILALSRALDGDTAALVPLLDTIASRTAPQGWYGSYPASGWHLATAIHALESFDVALALDHVAELRNHADTIEHWPILFEIEGIALLARGTADAGEDFSRRIAERHRRTPTSAPMRARLAALEADLLTSGGLSARARPLLAKFAATNPAVATAASRAHLDENAPEAALLTLDHIAWPEGGNFRQRAEVALLRATAFLRVGDRRSARQATTRALELLDEHTMTRPWMMIPRKDALALVELLPESRHQELRAVLASTPDVFSTAHPIEALTKRELLVLHALNETSQTAVIAEKLFVSPNTVKSQLRSLYRKLGATSRAEALSIAHERGLF